MHKVSAEFFRLFILFIMTWWDVQYSAKKFLCQKRVIVRSQLCQACLFVLAFNMKWQKDTQCCWILLIEPGSHSLTVTLHMSSWGCNDNMFIQQWQRDMNGRREERRGETRVEGTTKRRRKERGERHSRKKHLLFFSLCFMYCNC